MALAAAETAHSRTGVNNRLLLLFCVLLSIVILAAMLYGAYKIGTHHPASPCDKLTDTVERAICKAGLDG